MNIYIAGPMTGLPELNFPAFFAAEEHLRQAGHNPINPARLPQDAGLEHDEYIALDLEIIAIMANAVAFLPGWEQSPGASLEYRLAIDLNLTILRFKYCPCCKGYLIASQDNFSGNKLAADKFCMYCKRCNSAKARESKARNDLRRLHEDAAPELSPVPAGMKRGSTEWCKWHNEQYPIQAGI